LLCLAVSVTSGGNINTTAKYIGRDKESGRRVAVVEIDEYGNIMLPSMTVSRGSQSPYTTATYTSSAPDGVSGATQV